MRYLTKAGVEEIIFPPRTSLYATLIDYLYRSVSYFYI
jgi:hypothetical protein